MEEKKLPKSIRKFVRLGKARIRREILDIKKQEELINEVYQTFLKVRPQIEEKITPKTG